MNQGQQKQGIQTSELWVTVITGAMSLLVTYGVISRDEAIAWQGMAIALLPLIASVVAYIVSRTRVKTATAQQSFDMDTLLDMVIKALEQRRSTGQRTIEPLPIKPKREENITLTQDQFEQFVKLAQLVEQQSS